MAKKSLAADSKTKTSKTSKQHVDGEKRGKSCIGDHAYHWLWFLHLSVSSLLLVNEYIDHIVRVLLGASVDFAK